MTIRFATTDEITTWDSAIIKNADGGNVFQGSIFAELKQSTGWQPRYIIAGSLAILALEKHIPLIGKLWYLPKGPGVIDTMQLGSLLPKLCDFARKQGVFAVKLEPELHDTPEIHTTLAGFGLIKTAPIQPNYATVLIDIREPLDAVLSNLNQKGRHAINRAKRDGVTAKRVEATDANCQLMYQLLAGTAEGSFRIRSFSYYKKFWQSYARAHQGQLFFAYVNGQVVAGAFAIILGAKSTYKDGASIKERTAYGASHLLQWEVISWAKEHGALTHDLCGTPPSAAIKDSSHPHYGLGRFKTSFNKTVTDYIGAYDLVIRPTSYKLWQTIGERVVTRLHSKRFNENWW